MLNHTFDNIEMLLKSKVNNNSSKDVVLLITNFSNEDLKTNYFLLQSVRILLELEKRFSFLLGYCQ